MGINKKWLYSNLLKKIKYWILMLILAIVYGCLILLILCYAGMYYTV